ncbi:MAG TPA: PDZ domain-containing protein, partial [Candidatus Acidoferrum sp.]|nr:PDZ domain-containing protein [Candidatus Acidoferrum sp.]
PYLVPSHIFDRIAPVIANNAEQTPRSEPLKGTGDEGGQFLFRLAVATGGTPASPTAKRPSAALSQAEQELKALEEQERETDDQEMIVALQQQIEEKKKKVEEKKRKKIEEARVRPSENTRQHGGLLAAIRIEELDPQPQGRTPQVKRAIGVIVTAVEPDTVAALAGIQRGDIIQEVNRETIKSLEDYQRAVAKIAKDAVVLLLVKREGAYRFVPLNPR